jgi:hypothetical protein
MHKFSCTRRKSDLVWHRSINAALEVYSMQDPGIKFQDEVQANFLSLCGPLRNVSKNVTWKLDLNWEVRGDAGELNRSFLHLNAIENGLRLVEAGLRLGEDHAEGYERSLKCPLWPRDWIKDSNRADG